jgi:hypothetical protein
MFTFIFNMSCWHYYMMYVFTHRLKHRWMFHSQNYWHLPWMNHKHNRITNPVSFFSGPNIFEKCIWTDVILQGLWYWDKYVIWILRWTLSIAWAICDTASRTHDAFPLSGSYSLGALEEASLDQFTTKEGMSRALVLLTSHVISGRWE